MNKQQSFVVLFVLFARFALLAAFFAVGCPFAAVGFLLFSDVAMVVVAARSPRAPSLA